MREKRKFYEFLEEASRIVSIHGEIDRIFTRKVLRESKTIKLTERLGILVGSQVVNTTSDQLRNYTSKQSIHERDPPTSHIDNASLECEICLEGHSSIVHYMRTTDK